jgi:hypothetical protein
MCNLVRAIVTGQPKCIKVLAVLVPNPAEAFDLAIPFSLGHCGNRARVGITISSSSTRSHAYRA